MTTDNQDELFTVVDENDNIIGYRTRRECHSDKSLIHRSVQVVLFDENGKILLQKRSKTKDLYPSKLTVSASGHVNKGESYEECARREVREEIGLEVELEYKTKFFITTEDESECTAIFIGQAKGEITTNTTEVEEILHLNPEEINERINDLTPMAKRSFEELGIL